MAQKDDSKASQFPDIIELSVGGQLYVTQLKTLTSVPNSLLWKTFAQGCPSEVPKDRKGRFFFDRDGCLFRYILEYLRDSSDLVLPDLFQEKRRLQKEADFFLLHDLSQRLRTATASSRDPVKAGWGPEAAAQWVTTTTTAGSPQPSPTKGTPGYVTIGYRGTYTIGRDIQTDAKFRRVARITVCSKISLAKEVFGETLNESRDPDRTPDKYTSRYYLKYNFLEQAFDRLAESGFHMVACSSTGTCAYNSNDPNEDKIWSSYTEYVFARQ